MTVTESFSHKINGIDHCFFCKEYIGSFYKVMYAKGR